MTLFIQSLLEVRQGFLFTAGNIFAFQNGFANRLLKDNFSGEVRISMADART